MKVIFLDIDGVLYPCFSRRTSCFHAEAVRSRLQKEGISTEGIGQDLCGGLRFPDRRIRISAQTL